MLARGWWRIGGTFGEISRVSAGDCQKTHFRETCSEDRRGERDSTNLTFSLRELRQNQGNQEAEFVAWLRRVHERNVQNVIRDHMIAQKRALSREQSLDTDEHSPVEFPQADQTTASQRAMGGPSGSSAGEPF